MCDVLQYRGNFFQSEDWFRLLAEATGIEPVMLRDREGAIPCKRVGRAHHSLTNFYSIEYAPVGDYASLLKQLGPATHLQFLKDESIEQVFRDNGFRTFRDHQYVNWTCRIEGGFDAYFAARPSQLKNTLKRKSKALTRDHQLELAVVREPRPEVYREIYRASWKRPEPYPEFIPRLMEVAAGLGILRLGLAWIDGEPAAAQLWLVESGRVIIYKLAYKESFKATSVGTVLSHEMFRQAIDVDGVSLIDYGVGDEPYKRDWMTHQGEVFQLTCLDRSFSGTLGAALKSTKRALKNGVRVTSPAIRRAGRSTDAR